MIQIVQQISGEHFTLSNTICEYVNFNENEFIYFYIKFNLFKNIIILIIIYSQIDKVYKAIDKNIVSYKNYILMHAFKCVLVKKIYNVPIFDKEIYKEI